MSRLLLTACLALAALAQTKQAAKAAPSVSKAQASAPGAGSLTLPKDAVAIEPGLWKHRDATGKTWHYRKTPFGLVKFEPENEFATAKNARDEADFLRAVEDGDSVKFERKTPFGVSRWSRKKSELEGAELEAWKRASATGKK